MSETYSAATSESGENYARMAQLTVSTLGRAVIECDDTAEHHDENGNVFRAAKWNDPNPHEISKFYTLQQFAQPTGSFSYSLKVYRHGKPVEWYDFHDGLAYVCNRMTNSSKRLSLEEHQANYARATGYLRSTLAQWGYKPPLELPSKPSVPPPAPFDTIPGAVFTEADNKAFLDLVASLHHNNP